MEKLRDFSIMLLTIDTRKKFLKFFKTKKGAIP